MKKSFYLKITTLIFGFLFLYSCASDNCKNPIVSIEKSYIIKTFTMKTFDFGTGFGSGYCGWVIVAYTDSTLKNYEFYKPINIPYEFTTNLFATYEGEIEVLPDTFKCLNGSVDPNPEKPQPQEIFHFINIINYKRK